jgi:beta-phosphoglucomutase
MTRTEQGGGNDMPTRFDGGIFDVDGVLVDSPHEKAWRESLRELMESEWSDIRDRTSWTPEAFTAHVYQEEMSGKPRMSGAQAALAYFDIPDEEGTRATRYADRKQAMVVRLIEAGDFTAYPDALRFIIGVKDAGIRTVTASSSKNAKLFLRRIRLDTFAAQQHLSSASVHPGLTLLDFFDADVSGRDFAHGKPHPEMFLAAAAELGVLPEHSGRGSQGRRHVRDRRREGGRRRSSRQGRRRSRGPHARRRRHDRADRRNPHLRARLGRRCHWRPGDGPDPDGRYLR